MLCGSGRTLALSFATSPLVRAWSIAPLCSIAGSLGSQLFLRRLTPDNIVPRIVLLLGGICLVQIGNLAVLPLATSPGIVVCVYGVAVGVTGAVLSVMLVPIQLTVPNRMRGQRCPSPIAA